MSADNFDEIADRLITMSREYVGLAARFLFGIPIVPSRQPTPGSVVIFDGREKARVMFFFPSMGEPGMSLLLKLRFAQLRLVRIPSPDEVPKEIELKRAVAKEREEAAFEAIADEVRTKLLPGMNPVHRIILEKVFLSTDPITAD